MKRFRFIYTFIAGVILVLFGAVYGGYFAFPYPDMPPGEAARHGLHLFVSKAGLFGGVVLVVVSIAGGIMAVSARVLASPFSKALGGMAVLMSGFLYGACVALPLPNPPPQGPGWVGHLLASSALLLAGSGLLIGSVIQHAQRKRCRAGQAAGSMKGMS